MSQDPRMFPEEPEQKLLDRPAEERLREQMERDYVPNGNAPGHQPVPAKPESSNAKPKSSKKMLAWVLAAMVLLAAALFLVGYLPRHNRTKATRRSAVREKEALPLVNTVKVKRSAQISRLLLPGNITPLTEAPIYARATGYIVKRYVDIGDRVRANQLMAVIEAPELDQQVAQGRSQFSQARQQLGQTEAALQQSEAQLELAKVTWDRYAVLVQHGAVARQDADIQRTNFQTAGAVVNSSKANVRAAQDNVKAAQANLDRLIALQSYKEVRAPFAGVVTVRNVDVGTYISTNGGQSGATTYGNSQQLGAGSTGAGGGGGEMFRVAQVGRLRILINVPQADAATVYVGQRAGVFVGEFAGRPFPGLVTRSARSLDPATRTLLTEVQVDNGRQQLLPGMYAQVQFDSKRTSPPLLVPGDSLLSRANGMFVAVLLDPDPQKLQRIREQNPEDNGTEEHRQRPKQIHMQKVEVGRDYGTATEITLGLEGWEYVAANPSDEVYEGALVLPTRAKGSQAAAPAGGPTDQSPSASGSETSAGAAPRKPGSQGSGNSGKGADSSGKTKR